MPNVLIKYCGNKTLQDYQVTNRSEADYLGFVFAKSKRQVRVEEVSSWIGKCTSSKSLVGVFVNQSLEEILYAVDKVGLDVVQLHGNENPQYIQSLVSKANVGIWKAIHHENEGSLRNLEVYQEFVDGFVIDKKVGTQYGGTGKCFDWSFLPDYINMAKSLNKRCFIAGGINEGNLPELLSYHPDGIDISSGIERNFIKDSKKIQAIEKRVKKYGTIRN
ncbi:phosphoribosylanthranilate isomerase [Bacillus tianshenii]|nr:phosphoribosylanthranilate isomerase [Bacillus tianshenii]